MESPSMMVPDISSMLTDTKDSSASSDRELLLDILKSISRLEGMIMMQSCKPSNPPVGIPPAPANMFDLPPIIP